MSHSHSRRATKYTTAEAYAWAPNARLKTPEVLYARTKPRAISA